MNPTEHPRREPLDADEASLAKIVRALPGANPPSALDAAILAAARKAAEAEPARPPRRHHWRIGASIAALLVVGIVWQSRIGMDPPPQFHYDEPASAALEMRAPEDLGEATAEAAAKAQAEPSTEAPAPAATEPPAAADASTPEPPPAAFHEVQRVPAPHPAAPAPAPAAPAPVAAEPVPAPSPEPMPEPAPMFAPAPPPPPAPPAPPAATASEEAAADEASLDRIEVTGARVRASESRRLRREQERARSAPAQEPAPAIMSVPAPTPPTEPALPPVEADEGLPPADWIERIRFRLAAGQRDGALDSLGRFLLAHPGHPLPDDLRDLLE